MKDWHWHTGAGRSACMVTKIATHPEESACLSAEIWRGKLRIEIDGKLAVGIPLEVLHALLDQAHADGEVPT